MKKALIILAILITLLVYSKSQANEVVIIPDNSLRFRVIANSNNVNDFIIKNKVKTVVEKELVTLLENAKDISETKEIIKENLPNINKTISNAIGKEDIDYDVKFGFNYFPKKIFKGIIYNEGEYESLVITLGQGNGDNWWCVLFPPLCLLEENPTSSDVEYQLYVSRIINGFK
ncbi:MAG: stage II sporulation protein R [Bacilli bacterium]|nr:stage II sporulation protein R [Bacilli bacterium]MDD3896109.1 stage II sporulation protein R [Bacilli bacterium]MDD4407459.1 stage II sporulation protein R [Bacilli bacterium]